MDKRPGYNDRLFGSGFRSKLHLARFVWFKQMIHRLKIRPKSIIELGCFDGKLLKYLDHKPERYIGFDANWEGGLDIARAKWYGLDEFKFICASTIDEITLKPSDRFDVFVCMETLEHIPPDEVENYLEKISRHLDGYLFITVPNEKGLMCILKIIVKRLVGQNYDNYTLSEMFNAFIGRMRYVERREHKGFDYDTIIKMVGKYFDILKVAGQPLPFVNYRFSFTVTILGKSKIHQKLDNNIK